MRQRSCGNHHDSVRAPQNPAHGNTQSPPHLQARSQHPHTHSPCPALPSCRGKPQAHAERPLLPLEMDPAMGSCFKPPGERQPPAMGPGRGDHQAAAPLSCPIHPLPASSILSCPIPSVPSPSHPSHPLHPVLSHPVHPIPSPPSHPVPSHPVPFLSSSCLPLVQVPSVTSPCQA